jgi:hypothetical protein
MVVNILFFVPFRNQKYMEYLEYFGTYADIPVAEIPSVWERTYGRTGSRN